MVDQSARTSYDVAQHTYPVAPGEDDPPALIRAAGRRARGLKGAAPARRGHAAGRASRAGLFQQHSSRVNPPSSSTHRV